MSKSRHSAVRKSTPYWSTVRAVDNVSAHLNSLIQARLFYGWIVVGSASVALMAAFGIHRSYGMFLPLIAEDLGMGYGALSAPFSIYLAVYALLSLVTGKLTDQFGPRLIVMIGGACMGLGFGLIAVSRELWHIYIALCVVAAVGMSTAFVPLNATVVKWFVHRRGLALAVVATGNSAASLFGPLFAALFIPLFGWRTALTLLALTIGILICGSALLLVKDPEKLGLRPDGDPVNADSARADELCPELDEDGWTLNEALSTTAYWVLLFTFTFTWLTLFIPFVHLPVMMADLDHTPASTVVVLSAMGIGSLLGRFVFVWLLGRLGLVWGLYLALALQVLACALFAKFVSLPILITAGILFAAGSSAAAFMYLMIVGNGFGRLHAGALSGFIFAVAGVLASVGPYLAGVLRDLTGTYQLSFLLAAACNLTAMLAFSLYRAPRKP